MSLKSWQKFLRAGIRLPRQSYSADPDELTEGNLLRVLNGGKEAYPAMLAAIESARSSVHLETYILRDDKTGWRFAQALAARARAGVSTKLIFDSVGSLDLGEGYLQYLRNNGVSVLEYRPVAPWRRRWGWSRRDHRKILVVDGRIGFTGGMNIADDYADSAGGGGGWRDIQVQVEGPAAYELDRLFRAVWFREMGRWFPSAGDHHHHPGKALVQVAANHEFMHRHRIRRAYRHAIGRAEKSITIANAYFVPDRGIRRALYLARRRGVSVDILVPAVSDIPAVHYASRALFQGHLQRGLRLYAWPGPVLHTKAVIIDRLWSAVGSYNMDHLSWLHNLEVNLHVVDETFAGELEDSLRQDILQSKEITWADWRRRSSSDRLLERLFFLMHYWL